MVFVSDTFGYFGQLNGNNVTGHCIINLDNICDLVIIHQSFGPVLITDNLSGY